MRFIDTYEAWDKYAYIPSEVELDGMFKRIYGQIAPKIEDYYAGLIETEDRLHE